ncbi:MAG TPA: ATP-binding protein [Marinobacterium sp.]|nr:ATP-binding protein [Marinobacterium sp.]
MIDLLQQTHSFYASFNSQGDPIQASSIFKRLSQEAKSPSILPLINARLPELQGKELLAHRGKLSFELTLQSSPTFNATIMSGEQGEVWLFASPIVKGIGDLLALGISEADLAPADPLRVYLTELLELGREVELRSSELFHAERMASIGTLAAGVAHEINNPLAYVKSNIMTLQGFLKPLTQTVEQLLQLDSEDPDFNQVLRAKGLTLDHTELQFILDDLQEILEDLLDGSSRIVSIVNGLRQFSHPNSEELDEVDLNESVRVAIELSRNEFKYHANLQLELSDIPVIKANPGEITQVLVNLLVNASHAIGESGTISVGSRFRDERVEIYVEDSGHGIAPEDLGQIFTPFFTTKPIGEGTGLGLAISHRIITEHGGEIEVQSEQGKGTRFTLVFPQQV